MPGDDRSRLPKETGSEKTMSAVNNIITPAAWNKTAQQETDLALRCAELRMEAARLNATQPSDPHAGYLAAQLRDFAHLLEKAEREGLLGYQPYGGGRR